MAPETPASTPTSALHSAMIAREPRGPSPWLGARIRLAWFLASVGYVNSIAFRLDGNRGPRLWLVSVVALMLAVRGSQQGARAHQTIAWAGALALASVASPALGRSLDLPAVVAAAVALWVGLGLVSALPQEAGLASLPSVSPRGPRLLAAVASFLVFGAVVEGSGFLALFVTALGASALLAWLIVLHQDKRLDMAASPRLRGAAGALLLAALFVVVIAMAGLVPPLRAALVGLCATVAAMRRAFRHEDPVRIEQLLRRVTSVGLAFACAVIFGSLATAGQALRGPWPAAVATFFTAAGALAIGLVASTLEAPLRPAQGTWLDAVARAQRALAALDPKASMAGVLLALREAAGPTAGPCELWLLYPPRMLTVDAVGNLMETEASLPEGLVALASSEPEAIVRREVLDAVMVRRPGIRPIHAWMDHRRALAGIVLTREGEPQGLLVVPHGSRHELLALEEARALRALGDALTAVTEAHASLARSLSREEELRRNTAELEHTVDLLRHACDQEAGRHRHLAARWARPADIGLYSAPMRLALDALRRRVHLGAPLVVVAPAGTDPIAYLARVHGEGPRSLGPLVVVEGTATAEHDRARWASQRSPLTLAQGGMLVLLDAAALPLDVQTTIAEALAERRAEGLGAVPLDVQVAVVTAQPLEVFREQGTFHETLAERLGDALDAPILLPRLRERPEDLRSLVNERLAREGLRVKGTPMGMEDSAFAKLVEYDFPGELPELDHIVFRLVAQCDGHVVRARDIEALGLNLPAA